MFALRLFGGLSLESSAVVVPPGARQRRRLSLLALLALAGERGMSRERIQAFLWPESPPDRARHALDQLIYATRRDLGAQSVLSSTIDLRLNPAIVHADTHAFDEAVRAGRWEEAAQLYAGPILQGLYLGNDVELEQWVDAQRTRRERQYREALEALAEAAAGRGDLAAAVRWWQRRAEADPTSAPAALELMRALAAAGDRAGAVRHARSHQNLVRTALEVEPDPAVEALAIELSAPVTPPVVTAVRPTGTSAAVEIDDTTLDPPLAPDPLTRQPVRGAVSVATLASPARAISSRARLVAVGLVALGSVGVGVLAWRKPTGMTLVAEAATSLVAGRRDRPLAADHGLTMEDRGRPADPETRALALRARAAWEKRTKEGLEQAVVLYRLAAERDPTYAPAYAGLAQSYAMLGYFGFGPSDAMFPKAAGAATRAIELDSAAGEAYAALGQALAWERAWERSEVAYRRALELTPEDATVHQWYALLLAYLGRSPEAALHSGHASRLDPLSVQINNMHGMMLYYAGDLRGALKQYERTVEAEPDTAWVRQNPWVLSNFGRVLGAAGRYTEAIPVIERAVAVVPTHPRPLLDLAHVHVLAGQAARAREVFARADTTHEHYIVYRGLLHALLGELDEAFAWLDREHEWPLPALVQLSGERRYAPLRADPRFEAVRQRLGMTPRP